MTSTTSENTEVRYKIGDVCRIADVQPYVLRYWESEFPVLAPDRSVPGARTYSARELDLIGRIKRLLYDEGYTIAGAKKRLESEASGALPPDTNPVVTPLEDTRSERPGKGGRPSEKVPARPRPSSKAGMPLFVETSLVEGLPAAAGAADGVDPAKAGAGQAPDPRVARVVAELKEILEILSRD
ncbi:MAG TPA: MerR family transcriptional regulator [Thermoanaerobaculia bacterium]|nr:MerR family transcriptional regulator [Thermoanaerobaculia bacterium]